MVKDELLPALLWAGLLGPATQTSPMGWPHQSRVGFVTTKAHLQKSVTLTLSSCLYTFILRSEINPIGESVAGINYFQTKSPLRKEHGCTNSTTLVQPSHDRGALLCAVWWASTSTSKEEDDTTQSWLLTLSTEVSCLEGFHVYCTLFNVDGKISACLSVGVIHKHSQTAAEKDQS